MTKIIAIAIAVAWVLLLPTVSVGQTPNKIYVGLAGMNQGRGSPAAKKAWDAAAEIAEDLRSLLRAERPVRAHDRWDVQTARQLSAKDFFIVGILQPGGEAIEKYWITWQVIQFGNVDNKRTPLFVGDLILKTKFTFSSGGATVEVGRAPDIADSIKQILPGIRLPRIYFVHCFRGPVDIEKWDELNPQMTREIWEHLRDRTRGLEPAAEPNTYDQADFQRELCANRLLQMENLKKKSDYIVSSRLNRTDSTHAIVDLEISNQVAQRRIAQVEASTIDPESSLGKELERAAPVGEVDPIIDKKFCIDMQKIREPTSAANEARKFAEYIILGVLSKGSAAPSIGNVCG
jgi:predicted Fe-S protein YdhL (DUF1289 family)